MSRVKQVKPKAYKADGWENILTGLGGAKDKSVYTLFRRDAPLDPERSMNLFHGNDVARRICESVVQMAMRKGFELKIEGNPKLAEELMLRADDLCVQEHFTQGDIFGRASGAGAVFMNCDDAKKTEDLLLPLDRNANVLNLFTFDARSLRVAKWNSDITSRDFCQPEIWQVIPPYLQGVSAQKGVQYIHKSRLIVFPGAMTAPREKAENQGLDYSILSVNYATIRDFCAAYLGIANLMYSADQGVFKFHEFRDLMRQEGHEAIFKARMEAMSLSKSSLGDITIDSLDDYIRLAANFQSVSDVLDRFAQRLSAATGIPVTIFMGQDPKSPGLQATGDASLQLWYDQCQQHRTLVIESRLNQLFTQLTHGEINKFNIIWPPIDPNAEASQAELRSKQATIDNLYVQMGALDPSEVRNSRFTPDGFSTETTLDPSMTELLKESATEGPGDPAQEAAAAVQESISGLT